MESAKSYFRCWFGSDEKNDELNRLKGELEDARAKLDEARQQLRRIAGTNKVATLQELEESPEPGPAPFSNTSSNASNALPNATRPIPTFEHSTSTLIIHEKSNGQSALEKLEEKVKEKRNSRRNEYVVISDTEDLSDAANDDILNESQEESYDQEPSMKPSVSNSVNTSNNVNTYIQEIEKKHQETVNALKIKINFISSKLEQTQNEKSEMIKTLKEKDDEISKLKREVNKLKETQFSFQSSADETTDDERKQNNNNDNNKLNVSSVSNNKRPKSPKSSGNYDRTKEQIKILNTLIYKSKSLSLLMEQEKVSKSGGKGLILFFSKYLPPKTVDQIFSRTAQSSKTQDCDANYITNASGLVTVLSFVTILYKAKVHSIKTGSGERPKLDNADIKNAVKYLSIWIVRTYGEKNTK